MPNPKIAVITRTKNRPILLDRCLESLSMQSYKDFLWVVVNDNGEHAPVNNLVDKAKLLGMSVITIHREKSVGIAAAANNGILLSDSDFIHIHDDDDTLHPDFYKNIINFFELHPHYSGAVTCTTRVNEEILNDEVRIIDSYEYYNLDSSLFLADLIWKNQFSPISFVYKRSAFKIVGHYDENLPVLDDWDFNLRFLQKFDIGVIPKFLANYHWRVGVNTGGMAQTVTSGASLHQEYTAIIRNKMLRQDLIEGKSGLGTLMAVGRFHQLQSNALKIIDDKVEREQHCLP